MYMTTRQRNSKHIVNGCIDTIWHNYVKAGNLFDQGVQPQGVRSLIVNSWKRCRSVDPENYERFILSEKFLKSRLAVNQRLISIAVPIINDVFSIGGKNCILLCDSEGYVLETISNCDYTIPPGIKCSEEYLGTNAVGTALVEGGSVEIHGFEHYKSVLHSFSCAAVPIRDPDGNLIGVIDITNPFGKLPSGVITILKLGVQVIEHQLRWQKERDKKREAEAVLQIVKDSIMHHMLTVDSWGKITDANQNFLDIVGKNKENLIGVNFQKFLRKEDSYLKINNKSFMPGERFDLQVDLHNLPCKVVRQEQITTPYGSGKSVLLFDAVKDTVRSNISKQDSFCEEIIGETKTWCKTMKMVKKAAEVSSNVLIDGESGTGKELIARAIHSESKCRGSFVPINCGAIPKELIESELFGYEDGAFTGARKGGKIGKFEMADEGTLFLDEIGEMPQEMQVRLLRILQDRRIAPVGGTKLKQVNVRVLAATNRDLWQEVLNGRFREDLYYRLNVIRITVPPLRDRKDDIPLLASHFVKKYCHQFQKPVMEIDDQAMNTLCYYNWPGNVRELSNIIENAVVFTEGNVILEDVFSLHIKQYMPSPSVNGQKLKGYEKDIIVKTLEINKGNVSKTARDLGVARNTLYRKLKRIGLH